MGRDKERKIQYRKKIHWKRLRKIQLRETKRPRYTLSRENEQRYRSRDCNSQVNKRKRAVKQAKGGIQRERK